MGIIVGIIIIGIVIYIVQWVISIGEGTFLGKIIKFLIGIIILALIGGIFFPPLFSISLGAFLLLLLCLALLWFIDIFKKN